MISQQLAENMPAIIAAAAEPFSHVGQMTVLNGGEGVNKMLGGILAQAATTFLPSRPRSRTRKPSARPRRPRQPSEAPDAQGS